MLKIGLSGIAGCGKSSLILELKKILGIKYNIELLEDISNTNPFDDNKETNFISQFYYFSTQINEENKKSISTPEILLCDKTILDQWIYWKRYLSKVGEGKHLSEKEQVLKTIYDYWLNSYDIIFFIRVDQSVLASRETNNLLRDNFSNNENIENLYLKIIKKENIKVVEIWNNKAIDETIHKLAEKIADKLEKNNEN